MKSYTGIGSRDTPSDIMELMTMMAKHLSRNNWILRSGGAGGADQAFEAGCDNVNGSKEIYIPWANFEKSNSKLIVSNPKSFEMAEKYHPYWHNLSSGAKKLQARNCHQVLGSDLKSPSNLVICYTKNGKGQGGTGQAIRIAKAYNIPIFDCGNYSDLSELKEAYREFLKSVL